MSQPTERRPLPVWIRVLDAPATPTRFRLTRGSCLIGAGTAADIVIEHDTVSRVHAELTLAPEGVIVKDLESRNGTHYLGQRVGTLTLAPGSRFRVGHIEVAIEPDAEALAKTDPQITCYRDIIGDSIAMRRLFGVLTRLEGSLVSVLIEGESGSGKELLAHAIHEGSAVGDGAFVVVNCGAIARELVLSELFGHRKGSFTGATESRVGAFEAAHGGTLFLDEVGELPLEAQPTLLRALESGEVRPVGEVSPRIVKVRVVAATNRELLRETAAGRFREDLYYRLAVVKLTVPPLRERPEDLQRLALHFAALAGAAELPDDFLAELAARPWLGNARELRNAVQAYLAVGAMPGHTNGTACELEAILQRLVDPAVPYAEQKDELLHRFTRIYLQILLGHAGGNQSEAARVSGMDRGYLGKLCARYDVGRKP